MTQTIQPLVNTAIENAEDKGKTEVEKNIREILSVCDSLNNLCEKLSRLDYLLKRKNIEISLTQKGGGDVNGS